MRTLKEYKEEQMKDDEFAKEYENMQVEKGRIRTFKDNVETNSTMLYF